MAQAAAVDAGQDDHTELQPLKALDRAHAHPAGLGRRQAARRVRRRRPGAAGPLVHPEARRRTTPQPRGQLADGASVAQVGSAYTARPGPAAPSHRRSPLIYYLGLIEIAAKPQHCFFMLIYIVHTQDAFLIGSEVIPSAFFQHKFLKCLCVLTQVNG